MSLRRSLEALRGQPPRIVMLIRAHDEGPVGEKPLTERQMINRIGPILPQIAAGHVPTPDDKTARVVGKALEKMWNAPMKQEPK